MGDARLETVSGHVMDGIRAGLRVGTGRCPVCDCERSQRVEAPNVRSHWCSARNCPCHVVPIKVG